MTTTKPERLQKENLPVEIKIELDVDPASIGELMKSLKGHEGHKYPDQVNNWFSVAIDRKVCLIHSSNERIKPLDPKRHIHSLEGDMRKTFTTDASFHLVNYDSVQDLQKRVIARHPED